MQKEEVVQSTLWKIKSARDLRNFLWISEIYPETIKFGRRQVKHFSC